MDQRLNALKDKREISLLGGGKEKQSKQIASGKDLAYTRLLKLLDPGSFQEMDKFVTHNCHNFDINNSLIPGDGVITGFGTINGTKVAIYSQDFTCWGGALGLAHARKICKIMDMAIENDLPIIGLNDSGGARIQEGVESLAGYAEIFYRNVQASGKVPQISLILGPCAGGAVYSPAMTDFIFMVEQTSYMFVTGPDVIKTVTHENITKEELGGASAHHKKSGVSHLTCKDENHCFDKTRELLYFLSKEKKFSANTDSSQRLSSKIESIIPNSAKKPYDVREIIKDIADNNHFMEIQSEYAPNITVGFSEINGQTVGIVANQPLFLAGVLDIDASCKAARFVRFCDSFDIPIITLVDVPGFLPGTNQEHNGIIRHGAKLLFAYCEATTPMITVILRKAYGGAYDVMASKHIRADINLALPYAEIAVMGAEGAVNILHKKSLEQASDADKNTIRQSLMDQYEKDFSSPYQAASRGYIDEIILPSEVRTKIIYYLQLLKKKKVLTLSKKHSNIPL